MVITAAAATPSLHAVPVYHTMINSNMQKHYKHGQLGVKLLVSTRICHILAKASSKGENQIEDWNTTQSLWSFEGNLAKFQAILHHKSYRWTCVIITIHTLEDGLYYLSPRVKATCLLYVWCDRVRSRVQTPPLPCPAGGEQRAAAGLMFV